MSGKAPERPGLVLLRELVILGWPQKDLAAILGRPIQAVNEIVRGKKRITPETALELHAAIGDPFTAEWWLELEARYHLAILRSQPETMIRMRTIARRAVASSGTSRSRTGHR